MGNVLLSPDVVLYITRASCLAIVASASEVYPKECMGCTCTDAGDDTRIVAAFPYQLARRKYEEVYSESGVAFESVFKSGSFRKFGDYHSHPYKATEKLAALAPSSTDLNELPVNGIEIIVRIRKTKKKANFWRNTKGGRINVGWGQYRCTIGAFMRLPGRDKTGIPLYKDICLVQTKY
jgi:proteasome lid subunit RPN8/RPN11